MYIYNTTFMIDLAERDNFIEWMRSEALPELTCGDPASHDARLTCVVDVPGDPEFAVQASSFALQMEFSGMEEAVEWAESILSPVIERFTDRFGRERALTFATILETIQL